MIIKLEVLGATPVGPGFKVVEFSNPEGTIYGTANVDDTIVAALIDRGHILKVATEIDDNI